MNVSDAIAIVAVVVAGLALMQSWRATRQVAKAAREANDLLARQVALQDRLTQIEQSREHAKLIQSLQAVIRAGLCRTERRSWCLSVTNTGQGTAHNVAITLDGKPLLEHDTIPRGQKEAKIIGPESKVSYLMAITSSSSHPPFEFEATWDDDSGQQGRYGTTLTF